MKYILLAMSQFYLILSAWIYFTEDVQKAIYWVIVAVLLTVISLHKKD